MIPGVPARLRPALPPSVVGLLVLAATLPALPADARADDDSPLPRVGVIVLSAGDTQATTADNLTEILIAAISQLDRYEIVGKEEFQSILGLQSDKRALTCLHDTPCLSRVGLELGIAEVIVGSAGRRGKVWSLVLDRVDVKQAKVVRHLFFETALGEDELLGSVFGLADRLFGEADPAPPAVTEARPAAAPSAPPAGPAPAPPPAGAQAPPAAPTVGPSGMRIAAYATGGAGLAAAAVGLLYGLRVRNAAAEVTGRCCIQGAGPRQVYDMTRSEALSRRSEVESFATVANVMFAAGALSAASAIALWLLDDPSDPSDPGPARIGPAGDGAQLGLSLDF